MTSLRLFFALDTPAAVRTPVSALLRTLQGSGADVRWEPVTKLHCTIRFLGETDTRLVDDLSKKSSALALASPPVRIRYAGLGGFPDLRHPRVVWVGMDDLDGTLGSFYRSLEQELARLGIAPEKRAFHPHLTLGRVRGERNLAHLIRLLETLTLECEPASLTEVLLMKSLLQPSGSVYTILQAFPFGTR